MEHGVGRLLTSTERHDRHNGDVRSAFAIGDGYVLTAWHCVSGRGYKEAQWWLRLQPPAGEDESIDIPIKYLNHCEYLDSALLVFDEERVVDRNEELRKRLDSVALPLGVDVEVHEDIRIFGFPELNKAEFASAHNGKIKTTTFRIGHKLAIAVQVDAFGTRFPEHPKGMSGGPLARTYPGGGERVVGIVSVFPSAGAEGRAALGGGLVCRRIEDLQHVFPAVADAVRRSTPPPNGPPASEIELSLDVLETSRPDFESAGVPLPVRFTLGELSRIDPPQPPSRLADRVHALRSAVTAKPILLDIGAAGLEIGRLQVIYRREVSSWPKGSSLDALLVEAADVALNEARQSRPTLLGALARFVVGVAAALSIPPLRTPALANWITALGHQVADAQAYYRDRHSAPAWLVIDLGEEPTPGSTPWPARLVWTHFAHTGQLTQEVTVEPTETGLRNAIRDILRAVPPASPLLVDIAMPHALLSKGIEHWDVIEVDGELESFSDSCRPRLRWSPRRRELRLYSRCVERTARLSWETEPDAILDGLLHDSAKLKRWIRSGTNQAWLVGGHTGTTGTDPLRVLLREGCAFLIWFPADSDGDIRRRISEAVSAIPVHARRTEIPNELPDLDHQPAIVWDDPNGREGFALPPLIPAEHIQVPQL